MPARPVKTNWLGFEARIRRILLEARNDEDFGLPETWKLATYRIDAALAAHTLRGSALVVTSEDFDRMPANYREACDGEWSADGRGPAMFDASGAPVNAND